ncbi:MAG TPA: ribbon-helix-helix domain-containing protein [Gaiella sp.]|jgi:predicted transcriptional regulator|nr:ribbon-helix-helix domain-containing protein [Gaiella sp.]
MRTTLRLDDALLAAVRRRAAETGRTMTAVIEDALRQALARRPPVEYEVETTLPVASAGGALQPGVDLDDSAALLESMESGNAPR